MTGSRTGSKALLAGAYTSDLESLPTTGGVLLSYYNDSFAPTGGFVDDPRITPDVGNRDKSDPAPTLKTAGGSITIPMDVNELLFWLQTVFGASATPVTDAGTVTRTFSSGGDALQAAYLSQKVTDDKWKLIAGIVGNTINFDFSPADGNRQVTLGTLVRGVQRLTAAPAFETASPMQYTPKPVSGSLGTFKIEGTAVAAVTGGTINVSNQAELTQSADSSPFPNFVELGDTQARADLQFRILKGNSANDVLDYFQGKEGDPITASVEYVIDADHSLEVKLNRCWGEDRTPTIANRQRQSFSASLESFGGSEAACEVILKNQIPAS